MPPVIIAVAASWAASAAGAMVLGWTGSVFMAMAAKFFVAYAISAIFSKVAQRGGNGAVNAGQERLETIRSAVAVRKVIYGRIRTGGTLVYADTDGSYVDGTLRNDDGDWGRVIDNANLRMVSVIAHGKIHKVESRYWLADRASTDPAFAGGSWISMEWRNGDGVQPYIPIPAHEADWTSNHRLNDVAYAYLTMRYGHETFPNGMPGPTFLVEGRELFDPRTNVTEFSDNAALVVLDYLRADFGMRAPDSLVDFDSFIHAANVCDEAVPTYDNACIDGTVKRYTINGVVSLDAAPASILDSMESACAGQLVFSGGKYRMYVGEFQFPTVTIDETWLRGEPTIRISPSRAQTFNTARGTFVDPIQDWQQSDFPEIVDQVQLLKDETEIVQTMSFPLTTSLSTAQRLAKMDLYRNRNASSVHLPLNWLGMNLELWQTVRVAGFAPLGDRVYRVTEWSLATGGGIDVTLQEECIDMYDWDRDSDEAVTSGRAAIPGIFPWPVVSGVTGTLNFNQSQELYNVDVTFDASQGWPAGIAYYEIQYRQLGATDWQFATTTTALTTNIVLDVGDEYLVRVRAVSNDSPEVVGPWAYATTKKDMERREMPPVLTLAPLLNSPAAVTASWTAPSNVPGAIVGYEVQARPLDFPGLTDVLYVTDLYTSVGQGAVALTVPLVDGPLRGISVRVRAVGYGGVRGYWSEFSSTTF